MKILFVLPSGDTIYGSGRCAVQLARALELKFDLLVGKSLIQTIDERSLRENFGSNLGNIYQMWLPNANFYYGKNVNYPVKLAAIHKYVMWIINKKKFRKIIQKNDYDIIHLNSMILSPMIQSQYRMILHVREVFEGTKWQRKYIERKLHQAKGVIYINPSTRRAFDNRDINQVIIQDPFEMTHLSKLDASKIRQDLGLKQNAVIFSILGRYEDRNGTEFIINTFHQTRSKNIVLLVVGRVSTADHDKIERIIDGDTRIKLLGEWKDPGPIFAISDYILRGEHFFSGFSRTVYEGLYSGCKVIFPGKREEATDSLQYDRFKDELIFYPPRDERALTDVIDQCANYPVTQRNYMSNREKYVEAYLQFIEGICS